MEKRTSRHWSSSPLVYIGLCVSLSSVLSVATAANTAAANASDNLDNISYSIGANVGKSLRAQNVEINTSLFLQGLQEGLQGKFTRMKEEDIEKNLIQLQQKIIAQENAQRQAQAVENQKAALAFLESNKKKPGITVTSSGLQYEVLSNGPKDGVSPTDTDTVVTHYRGTLIDGTEFDSSYKRGQPAEFPVNAVIPGWTEALKKMKPGDKWKIYLPPQLAYGERGAPPQIGPQAALVFEVELVSVQKPAAAK